MASGPKQPGSKNSAPYRESVTVRHNRLDFLPDISDKDKFNKLRSPHPRRVDRDPNNACANSVFHGRLKK